MGLFDLFDSDKIDSDKKKKKDYDVSVFDTDRFKNNGSGNWVDWEDVCTGEYKGDGLEHPNFDKNGEW